MYNSGLLKNQKYTPNHIVLQSLWHYIPFVGDFARYIRSIPSDYDSILSTLNAKESASIMIGGVKEMIESPQKIIRIPERKGIFKLALESGTPLVPVITYGENELFSRGEHWILDNINDWLYSNFSMGIPFISWAAIRNWCELAYKPLKPINSYTGKPISVTRTENPSDTDIEKLKDLYLLGVEELFKATAPPDYSLKTWKNISVSSSNNTVEITCKHPHVAKKN